jgi:hypothetical protein
MKKFLFARPPVYGKAQGPVYPQGRRNSFPNLKK